MKKRLIFIVMAVILILSFVLAGCNLFTIDDERDANQVVASVKHNGLVAEITKQEFVSYFNSMYPSYYQYFKWEVDTAGEIFISTMAQEKMTLILAVEQLAGENIKKDNFNAIVKSNVSKDDPTKGYGVYAQYLLDLLDPDEQKYVKEQTNKVFIDAYNEELETALENEKIKAEEENTDSDTSTAKEPRPKKDEQEDTTFKKDSSVKPEDVAAIKDFFNDEKYKPNSNSTSFEKDAYNKQERNYLTNAFRTYEYYLAKQAESRILTKYQDSFVDTSDVTSQVTSDFKTTMDEQKKNYKTASNYKSAIEGDGLVLFHNGRYVKLKSILLQFSEEQQAALSYITSRYDKENQKDYVTALREALVFGLIDNYNAGLVIPDAVSKDLLGLMVYESNPDYDPKKTAGDPANNPENKPDEEMNYPYIKNPSYNKDEEESATNSKWKQTPFLEIIERVGAELKSVDADITEEKFKEEYPDADMSKEEYQVGFAMYKNQKRIEAFEKWIYLVNDDPGMFEGKDYTESPIGTASSYVTEFTALVRQLLADNQNASSGSVMINANSSDQTVTGNIVKTMVKVDKMGDKNLWEKEEVAIYTDTENDISFIINEFGVHIVILTEVPVDEQYNKEGLHYTVADNKDFEEDMGAFANYTDDEKNEIIAANKFFVFNKNAYVDFDDETGKAVTVAEKLEKTIKDTFDDTAYSNHSKKLFSMYGDKLFDSKDDKEASEGYANFKFEEIKLNKSVYNKILSEAKSAY